MSALDIEGVLAGHRLHGSMNICTGCDWRPIMGGGHLREQHEAHVAAVLREQIAEWLAGEALAIFDTSVVEKASRKGWNDALDALAAQVAPCHSRT